MSWPVWRVSDVLSSRPAVRMNQLGYLPGRPVAATLISETAEAVRFVVRDWDGADVGGGMSSPWAVRPEPTSGMSVHVIDFSTITERGDGFVVEVDGERSHPFTIGADLYGRLCDDALGFFRIMRAGPAIADGRYARPAGHPDTAVRAWSGADAEALYPGWRCDGEFDVSGGWYDAGDFGKYVTSGSIAVWQLLSTVDLLDRDDARADRIREECRWQLDWMLRMQVPPGRPLAGMVFHRVHGTRWSPIPGWPHEDPTERVLHRSSTGATLHLAAVAAHATRAFAASDAAFAARLLDAARVAWGAATSAPRLIAPDDRARFGGGPYGDDDLDDDFYWAACELWLTTHEDAFASAIAASPCHRADVFPTTGYDYDRVAAPARLDLALHGQDLVDHARVRESVADGATRLLELQRCSPWGQPYSPHEGWGWGSNGRILNNLVVLGTAQLLTGDERFTDGVAAGMDYLLGRNALGQSYITGYGTDSNRHPRTRLFARDRDPAFPPPPPGAICGGANSTPSPDFPYDDRLLGLPPQLCYLDEPTSEVTNDVCIRWNAPLVWATAFLSRRASRS